MTKAKEFISLKYPSEPKGIFVGNDIEQLVIWAEENNTSDITIQNEEYIICEIYGKKHKVTNRRLTKTEVMNIIRTIYKADSALVTLNGQEINTAWKVKINREKELRFRVNMKSIFINGDIGYSITIRLIPSIPPLLCTLNLPQEIIDNISPLDGLVLVVGATGTGKSTLLSSIIDNRLRDPNSHIKVATYENPIEFTYEHNPKPTSTISQVEIGINLLTYDDALNNSLRCAADVLLVGELKGRKAIAQAIKAALEGDLVYSTLHSKTVADVINRMLNEFSFEERNARALDILSSIRMIIAQRLVESIDGKRVALREYLVFTQDIVDHLLKAGLENLTYEIRALLKKNKTTFLDDAEKKLNQGFISEEVFNSVKKSVI